MILDLIRRDLKHFGIWKTTYDVALTAANRLVFLKVLRGMRATQVDQESLQLDSKYKHGFLDSATLRRFARDKENGFSEEFVARSLARGDECYGILDGEVLAYSGWYASKPTPIEPPELQLHFRSDHIYMYKAWTAIKYRGQRLHRAGLNLAFKSYLERGFKGLVAYNESNVFSSLTAGYKMGHRNFGNIYVMRVFNKYLIYPSKGCEDYDFGLSVIKPDLLRDPSPIVPARRHSVR